ncbi:NF045616 family extracytoplasmic (lipo)protein [Acinetobacter ursingii]|uniref:NF045616 family extracytoplasmic (lipo)protein n=1 Tax=Acinetobacter ursingii TaxID=108980 RepID=UPI00300AA735
MKQKFLILLLFPLSITTQASPEKKLYATVKNNNVCVFTNDAKTQPYNNQIYLYLGHIIQDQKFRSSYNNIYKNIKMPIYENECITIDQSNFKRNIPYDIVLDMSETYSIRTCITEISGKISLKKVVDGYTCQIENKDIKKENNLFNKILNWFNK